MNQPNVCRLCVSTCEDGKSLYDPNGQSNELRKITSNYFHPQIINMDEEKHLSIICLKCWRSIWDFHNFQTAIEVAQLKLLDAEIQQIIANNLKLDELQDRAEHAGAENPPSPKLEDKQILFKIELDPDSQCSSQPKRLRPNTDLPKAELPKERIDDVVNKWLPSIKCVICSETFPELVMLSNHFQQKHPKHTLYFECCNQKFNRRSLLKEHAILHKDPNAFQCDLCVKPYASKQALRYHISRVHSEKADFHCELCGQGSQTYKGLQLHWAKKHPTDPAPKVELPVNGLPTYPCSICNHVATAILDYYHHYWFEHKGAAKYSPTVHQADASRDGDIQNAEKGKKAITNTDISSDSISEYNGMDVDIDMDVIMNSDFNINDEDPLAQLDISPAVSTVLRQHPEESVYDIVNKWLPSLKCELCLETFQDFKLLQTHFAQKHPQESFYISCCSRKYSTSQMDKLKEHALVHRYPNTFKCHLCGKSYLYKSSLKLHVSKKHPEYEKFNCKLCNHFSESHKAHLSHYSSIHPTNPSPKLEIQSDGRTKYPCTQCNYASYTLLSFYHHYWFEHNGAVNRLWLDYCLENQSNKKSHTEALTSNPKFQEKVPQSSKNPIREMSAATENLSSSPQQCPDCGRIFSSDRDMVEHLASSHRNMILYYCPCCPQTFEMVTQIAKHRRKKHSQELKIKYYQHMDDNYNKLLQKCKIMAESRKRRFRESTAESEDLLSK